VRDGLDRLRSTYPQKTAETNRMPVHLYAEIVDGIGLSPQFMTSDAFAKYRFAEKARFAFEFPILGFPFDVDDTLCGSFCELIWARPDSGQSPVGWCVAVTAVICEEPET
jgi:hypothetical protein